jgi:membrane-anchored protein YejM (alkaline phosphatase superfamily)
VRPDYLGAYNPGVDFTPRLDQFARESLVFHNGFTPYAGTTMAEPAIWSGALLLHAHYLQPFRRVNSLEKLAQANDYEMYVSWDTVLRVLLDDSPRLHRLDEHANQWNQVEMCSTLDQLKTQLSGRRDSDPIFFYSQPMNVHQFADNPLPSRRQAGWKPRIGFSPRISFELNQVDGCFGTFIDYLKTKSMYENSMIILVSDHGDATGELGRVGHSTIVYPEVMRIPFVVHLPNAWQNKFVFDTNRLTTLIDIAPSLYYLLGQAPIRDHPLLGRPIFTATRQELDAYQRPDLFLASDVQATYGILDQGRYFYATYDLPERSYLYDFQNDPLGERDILTPELKSKYDRRIVQYLQHIDDFYGYRPPLGSWFAAK